LDDPFYYKSASVLVSYAYFEKDARQRANFEFFLAAGTAELPAVGGGEGSGSSSPSWWQKRTRRRQGRQGDDSDRPEIHFAIAVAGGDDNANPSSSCSPCAALDAFLPPPEPPSDELDALGIASARLGQRFTLLRRARNEGLDLASHNATLSLLALRGRLRRYRFFFLLNSSAQGPFTPSWTPPGWHWTHAYTSRMGTADAERAALAEGVAAGATADASTTTTIPLSTLSPPPRTVSDRPLRAVRAVASSLVCLPEHDAGGPGARLESWAVALDELGLAAAVRGGALALRGCKTCADADGSVVVGGEYALTRALLDEGHNVATLMAKYARGVDWSDVGAHGRCNDNAHASRVGTLLVRGGGGAVGGDSSSSSTMPLRISQHPFETIFVKSAWHVASPYTRAYASWELAHLLGRAGTEGEWVGGGGGGGGPSAGAPPPPPSLYGWGVSEQGTTGAAGAAAAIERAYASAATPIPAAVAVPSSALAGGSAKAAA
jgi:hypothetical protein